MQAHVMSWNLGDFFETWATVGNLWKPWVTVSNFWLPCMRQNFNLEMDRKTLGLVEMSLRS